MTSGETRARDDQTSRVGRQGEGDASGNYGSLARSEREVLRGEKVITRIPRMRPRRKSSVRSKANDLELVGQASRFHGVEGTNGTRSPGGTYRLHAAVLRLRRETLEGGGSSPARARRPELRLFAPL